MNPLTKFKNIYFVGVAGTGMSAIAQFLAGKGFEVSGSDRQFTLDNNSLLIQKQLEAEGISCFPQNGSGINKNIDVVVVSTAIEEQNIEYQKAISLGITIMKRAEMLAAISSQYNTIAVAGTSGKSTTSAMLFHILHYNQLEPSIISGAGLTTFIKQGKIGNAHVGKSDILVIEADESDGSIVFYKPKIGLLLNVDKDHQELHELEALFNTFKKNTQQHFIVNTNNELAYTLSSHSSFDFGTNANAKLKANDFIQNGFNISFKLNEVLFKIPAIGKHNMENALAAIAVAQALGVSLENCAKSLTSYEGIYRRTQILGNKNGTWVIDDYAHNPAKIAAAIASCQPISKKVIAWFQPHGYGPTRFLRHDFVQEISKIMRTEDEIWMSEIYYAGGTATKDISANDLIQDLIQLGCKAYFVEDRNNLIENIKNHLQTDTTLLLMGARDPSLANFAEKVYNQL